MPIRSILTSAAQSPAGSSSFTQQARSFRALEQGSRTLAGDGPGASEETAPSALRAAEQSAQVPGEFLGLVKGFLGDVNHMQARSSDALKAFVAGDITDLHQVMVASQEAGIAMDLLIEVRNRVVESFQEIMRIQV